MNEQQKHKMAMREAARIRGEAHFAALDAERKIMSPKLIEMKYVSQANLCRPIKKHLDRNNPLFITYVALRVYLTSLGASITELSTDNDYSWEIQFLINGSDILYTASHNDYDGYHFATVKREGHDTGATFARFADLIQAIMQTKESLTAPKH